MAVTSQQIAQLAGVSRGTVDRALHNRGRVNPEVAARIQKIAEELGYRPNSIGQALVRARQGLRLGAILQSAETPTMQDVASGARQAAEELRASGVEVELREVQGRDTAKVLRQIDELMDWGAGGLAIASNNTPDLVRRIDFLHEQGVPVVTFNTDAPDSKRLCFVGMDSYRAGQTAAGLVRQMLPPVFFCRSPVADWFFPLPDMSTTALITTVSGASWIRCRAKRTFISFPSSPALTGTTTPTRSPSIPFGRIPPWPASTSPPTASGAFAGPLRTNGERAGSAWWLMT